MGATITLVVWVERTISRQGQMVLRGESRGFFFSTSLVKYFGYQKLPKMGRYDSKWITI
jgi:hypothetical protein